MAIALNTFREAVRDKILYVLLVFGLIMIMVSRAVGWISYGGEDKIMIDLGLFAIWAFSAMISIFIGTGMIYKEIDKRTLYTILSKPIQRWEFVLGKYLGLLLTTGLTMGLLSCVFLGYLAMVRAPMTAALPQALVLTFFEMMIVTALAIFFSSASTPILSAIFTFLLFTIGQLTKWLVDLGVVLQKSAPWAEKLLNFVYLFLPNLHDFNIRQKAVQAVVLNHSLAISHGETWSVAVYGLSYTAALILAAIFLFRRRNF